MKDIWLAIVTDVDDGRLHVNGIFDNEASAKKCVDDDFLASSSLIYKVEPEKIKSIYLPFEDE
ncbi:hypothetical protein [Polynucleobacter asymbioticus]|jgi:hypothetical protein|uniref:hypothetical protein n=1 Tax=Polynucleobacter asymbioticus TaxID=576611 RepID=UPI0002ECE9F1|nr:hypothetical protein [Polynucleobacter asymbioticus]MBT8573798.1 hypothetical protein [Polynucleobacter paneuropaeus]